MKQYKNTVQTIQNEVNTNIHITKTPHTHQHTPPHTQHTHTHHTHIHHTHTNTHSCTPHTHTPTPPPHTHTSHLQHTIKMCHQQSAPQTVYTVTINYALYDISVATTQASSCV